MKHLAKRVVFFSAMMMVCALTYYFNLSSLFSLENIQSKRNTLVQLVHNHYGVSLAGYMILYTLIVALSIPGATALTLAGGFFLA